MEIVVSKNLPFRREIKATIKTSLRYSPVKNYHKITVLRAPRRERDMYFGKISESKRNKKNLIIRLNPKNSLIRMISTVFHEMRHAHQFCSGMVTNNKIGYFWKNRVFIPYFLTKAFYGILPWERDAVRYENWMTLETCGTIAENED